MFFYQNQQQCKPKIMLNLGLGLGSIIPAAFSCPIFIKINVKCNRAYWHFIVALVSEKAFKMTYFGPTAEKQTLRTVYCSSVWDVGKGKIK